MKLDAVAVEAEEDDVRGINTKAQLAEAEAVLQQRLRKAALDAGVTLVAPETVFLSRRHQIRQGRRDRALCRVRREGARSRTARSSTPSRISPARMSARACSVGPFARLRPGAQLGEGARIGNFVEVKEAAIAAGAKANHLSLYRRCLGRRRTPISAPAPSPAITTAPPSTAPRSARAPSSAPTRRWSRRSKIGDGAYVGSGSVITADVPADALALGRARQVVKEGWATRLRALKSLGKKVTARD